MYEYICTYIHIYLHTDMSHPIIRLRRSVHVYMCFVYIDKSIVCVWQINNIHMHPKGHTHNAHIQLMLIYIYTKNIRVHQKYMKYIYITQPKGMPKIVRLHLIDCMYIHIYIYIYKYIYIYIYTYIYIYIYI